MSWIGGDDPVRDAARPLVDFLAQDREISKHGPRAELEKMCDPAAYLGLAGEMVDRVLKAEAAAKRGNRLVKPLMRSG